MTSTVTFSIGQEEDIRLMLDLLIFKRSLAERVAQGSSVTSALFVTLLLPFGEKKIKTPLLFKHKGLALWHLKMGGTWFPALPGPQERVAASVPRATRPQAVARNASTPTTWSAASCPNHF